MLLLHDRVDVPEPETIVITEREHDKLFGLALNVRLTVPANPFTGEIVIILVPVAPELTVMTDEPDCTVKSCMLMVTSTLRVTVVFVPETLTA
jgi:hypothetical protein